MALGRALIVSLLAGAALAACGTSAAQDVPAEKWTDSSPDAFSDDFSAKLAADRGRLWLAVLGANGEDRSLRVKVFARGNGRWESTAGIDAAVSSASPISFAVPPDQVAEDVGAPCLGLTTVSRTSEVRCLNQGSWKAIRLPDAMRRSCQIVDLYSYRGGLVALTTANEPKKLILQAWKLDTAGWHRLGNPVKAEGGVGLLGQNSDPNAIPDILLTTFNRVPERRVLSLRDGRWEQPVPPLKGPGMGPTTSGSVRHGDYVYIPVDVATERNWPLSVFSFTPQQSWRQVGERKVNSGVGSAQGGIDYAAGNVWVTWQQNDSSHLKRGLFPTQIFAQCLTSEELGEQTLLWKGLSIGPGSVQIVGAEDQEYALFMRPSGRDPRGLHATVRPVSC